MLNGVRPPIGEAGERIQLNRNENAKVMTYNRQRKQGLSFVCACEFGVCLVEEATKKGVHPKLHLLKVPKPHLGQVLEEV